MHRRRSLGEVVVASFFLQLFALLTPLFTQVVIDKVLVHKGFTTLHVLAVGMIGLALFEAISGGCGPISFLHTTNRIERGARCAIVPPHPGAAARVLRSPPGRGYGGSRS